MRILLVVTDPKEKYYDFVRGALLSAHHEVYAAFAGGQGSLEPLVVSGRIKPVEWSLSAEDLSAIAGSTAGGELESIRRRIMESSGGQPFDAVILQSLSDDVSKIGAAFAGEPSTFLYTFFSDDELSPGTDRISHGICLEKARFVVVSSDEIGRAFINETGSAYMNKLVRWKLGVGGLDDIDQTKRRISKSECRRLFSEMFSNLLIVMGNENDNTWRYEEAIEALKSIPRLVQTRLTVIIDAAPESAEGKEYIAGLYNTLNGALFEYHVVEEPLGRENSAALRCAADMYLHFPGSGKITDELAEYMYSETCACLLKTEVDSGDLDKIGGEFYTFSEFSELPSIVEKIYKNRSYTYNSNSSRIRRAFSWEAASPIWESLMRMK